MTGTEIAHERPLSIPVMAANLMAAGLLAGLILAVINHFTQPIREDNERKLRARAMEQVLPAAARFEPIPGFPAGAEWHRGLDDAGQLVGYVLPVSTRGYEGHIEMMLGIDPSLAIVDFQIVKHRETPGLGAKAVEDKFRARFRGHTVDQLEVAKSPEPGKILAITGATITSRAIAVAFQKRLGQLAELAANDFREIPAEVIEE